MDRLVMLVVAGLMCGAGLPGCAPMTNSPGDETAARLRVIHASPDAPAVDVCADGQVAFSQAPFPSATAYASLDAATYAIQVIAAGAGCDSDAVIAANLPLEEGQDVSVVAVNFLSDIEPLVLVDDNASPGSGNAKVRFVHAGPDAPTVDITLTDGTTLFDDISFKEASDYLQVAAGSYDLQVRDATGETVVLTLNGVELVAGKVYTVFAVGLLNGEPALDAFVSQDN